MAKQLSAYGIKPKTVRLGHDNTPKGYELSEFKDAFARYLPPAAMQPPQRNAPLESSQGMDGSVADEAQPSSAALTERGARDGSSQISMNLSAEDDPLLDSGDPLVIEALQSLGYDIAERPARLDGGDSEAAEDDPF